MAIDQDKKDRNEIVNQHHKLLALNIACLREIYGESRENLAEAIGITYQAISNYENGIQPPQRNELFLIAEHYNVSMDDLFNYDFSNEFIEIDALLNDESNRQSIYKTLFPIVNIDNTVDNADFKKAYELHIQIRDEICASCDGMDFARQNIDKCTRLYRQAAEDGILEACANLLWWPMLQSIGLAFFNKKIESSQSLKSKDATIGDMLRAAYLKNYHDLDDDLEDDIETYIRSEYLGIIIGNIALLKNSDDALLRELADYYIAIAYKYNVMGIGRVPKNRGRLMGEEMLRMFNLMGNHFVKKYYSVFRDQDES